LVLATAKLKITFTAAIIFSTMKGIVNKLTLGTMCCVTGCYIFVCVVAWIQKTTTTTTTMLTAIVCPKKCVSAS
jgi:hypothetical protein